MEVINKFCDDYGFLNGCYEVPVKYMGRTYRCSELAYCAQKSYDSGYAKAIQTADVRDVFLLSKKVKPVQNWDEMIKLTLMYNVTWCKFIQNHDLQERLLETGGRFLIDVNDYGDELYGVYNGKGENVRGFILMNIRGRLKHLSEYEIETPSQVKDSPFYKVLSNFGIDFEYSTQQHKDYIINKFIDLCGYDELLYSIFNILAEDETLENLFEEEINYLYEYMELPLE